MPAATSSTTPTTATKTKGVFDGVPAGAFAADVGTGSLGGVALAFVGAGVFDADGLAPDCEGGDGRPAPLADAALDAADPATGVGVAAVAGGTLVGRLPSGFAASGAGGAGGAGGGGNPTPDRAVAPVAELPCAAAPGAPAE